MMHPHTELRFISEQVGHGVVATQDILAGTMTWVQDRLDREFAPEQVERFGPLYLEILDKYCFRNQHGRWVLCWDHARFVNHSFNSNCLTTAYNFEIAIRDIRAGEEITDDYGYLNISRPFRPTDEGSRRKIVYPDDLIRYHPVWDQKLRSVWPRITMVDQPLNVLLDDESWQRVCRIARGEEQMKSILECYFRNEDTDSNRSATGDPQADRHGARSKLASNNGSGRSSTAALPGRKHRNIANKHGL